METQNPILNLSPKISIYVWGITLLIFLVIVIILAIRLSRSIYDYSQNNGMINQYLASVPSEKIATISAIYQNTRKHLSTSMLLALVGGTFGIHRAYLGKRKSAMAMFLFFWTGIPSIISLFDLTGMPRTVSEFNLAVIRSLYEQLTE